MIPLLRFLPAGDMRMAIGVAVSTTLKMGLIFLMLALLVVSGASQADSSRQTVLVGYSPLQPPFAVTADGSGLIRDVLAAMQSVNGKYHFVQKRLYGGRAASAFESGNYHLIAFQNRSWGFEAGGVEQSLVLMKDRGAYFTLAKEQRAQDGRPLLAATRGFRYGFADFSIEKLEAMPNVLLAANERDVVKLVVHGRVRMGVASESLLRWYQHSDQELGSAFKVLPKSDYRYDRSFVISPHSPIQRAALNRILLTLQETGDLGRIFAAYGLAAPPLTPDTGVVLD